VELLVRLLDGEQVKSERLAPCLAVRASTDPARLSPVATDL